MIESKILSNAHFHGIRCEDKSKPGKYNMLKQGELRVHGPKVKFKMKSIHPIDEDQTLKAFVAKELA